MKVKIHEVEIPLPRFSDEKYKKMYICKYKLGFKSEMEV